MASKSRFVIQATDSVTPELIKIQKSFTQFQTQVNTVSKTLGNFAKGAVAGFGISTLVGLAGNAVKTWMDWEKANQRLTASLNIGANTNGSMIRSFQQLADTMESVLNVDDKIILNQVALQASLGRSKKEIEDIMRVSADSSVALGTSFEAMSEAIGKTFTSGVVSKELKKMVPELATMSVESLKAGGAIGVLNSKFAGMAEASNTGAFASINRLNSGFENLGTEVGRFIAGSTKPLTDWFASLVGGSAQTLAEINNLRESLETLKNLRRVMGESETTFETRNLNAQKMALVDAYSRLNTPGSETANNPLLKRGALGRDIESNWDNARIKFITEYGEAMRLLDQKVGTSLELKAKQGIITLYDIQDAQAKAEKAGEELDKQIQSIKDKNKPKDIPITYSSFGGGGGNTKAPEKTQREYIDDLISGDNVGSMSTKAGVHLDTLNKINEEVQKVIQAEKNANEESQKWNESVNKLQETFSLFKQFLNPINEFYGAWQELQNATAQNELDNLNKALSEKESKYQSELELKRAAGEDTTAFELEQTAIIEAQKDALAQKEKEYKRKTFEADKASKLGAVGMKMAEGIMAGVAMGLPLGPAYAIFAGASGAAQMAFINSMPTPEFAVGSPFFGGGEAIVGERGREKVILPRGSQIIPNARTEAGFGGSTTVNNYTINGFVSDEMIREIEKNKNKLSARGQL